MRHVVIGTRNPLGHSVVLVSSGIQVQRPQAFGIGLLGHQAAPHVGVVHDCDPRRRLIRHLGQIRALHPLLGEGECVEIARRQCAGGLNSDGHASMLNHREHLRNPVVHAADQIANGGHVGTAERQFACRRGL
ncbi:Uncharacterised protein [Mycobacterium tuberculosis]|uniref:Uncharacterized protein n=1 Tax=Mycobacterium tuberculosis TaxID=1773 RepID=A0A654TXG4_MYCTX|nr:Uncharacterised protein [Mycobacterium tuberculosis]CFR70119.1 Uncharacterised protein [Mycobacterium tuberculosis]CKS60271.1 Uncharacterised protein [Mycobacterium tuberculosis]CKT11193.1 Uncharacterised protein [Mycobacterium tuberculosis]CKU57053.1 Uncharacterised protein [Mycobacterium tuberculosis]